MKKIILISLILFSLSSISQQSTNKTCYMLQGNGAPYSNLTVSTWSANNLGKQKFYYDMYNNELYVFDYESNDWTLVNKSVTPTLQKVVTAGATVDIKPINFTNGDNASSIDSEELMFYYPLGMAEYGNGSMQVKSNEGNYILINPDIGVVIKTKKDGLNGGSELIIKSDNLSNTRFQQATDANGIIPVIGVIRPIINEIGKKGEMRISGNEVFFWTDNGWKSITLN